MKKNFLLSLISVALLCSCSKNKLLTEQEAIDVINCFDAAWKNKDVKAVDSVLAPAYVYFTQSGGLFSRGGVVQTAGSNEYKLDYVRRHAVEVTLHENTAVVSTRWEGRGIFRGVPFDEGQRCSITVIKSNNGKVQILSEHCTPVQVGNRFH